MKAQISVLCEMVNVEEKMQKVQTKVISRYYEQEDFEPNRAKGFVLLESGEGSGRQIMMAAVWVLQGKYP